MAGQEHASERAPAEAARHSALAGLSRRVQQQCSALVRRVYKRTARDWEAAAKDCDAVLALAPANQKAQLRCTNARENTWAH